MCVSSVYCLGLAVCQNVTYIIRTKDKICFSNMFSLQFICIFFHRCNFYNLLSTTTSVDQKCLELCAKAVSEETEDLGLLKTFLMLCFIRIKTFSSPTRIWQSIFLNIMFECKYLIKIHWIASGGIFTILGLRNFQTNEQMHISTYLLWYQ